ncbi:MAG TPA: PQQ-binding-like beta-propeller repeat protein [Planctomycetaceae bacterium]|nr:PQQ-binding-like beta-propeller repeat protein [Planctomycetaceae bacterium]
MNEHDDLQPGSGFSLMDLIFAGFNSRVFALDRETGRLVWNWHAPKGRSHHVAVLLDGDRLVVSVQGYMYCLDPLTGEQLWENPLTGFGVGIPGLASLHGNSGSAAAAALIAQQQQAAAAGAT